MYKVEVIVNTKDESTRLADELLKRHFNTHDEFNSESIKVTEHKMVTVSNPTQRGKSWLRDVWNDERIGEIVDKAINNITKNTKGNGMKREEKELTYGETIKQPFPEYEDIEKDKGISMPPWLTHNLKSGLSDIDLYAIAKTAYESGLDVTWKLSSKDPHAEIKAEYEEDLKKYDVVKVFFKHLNRWIELRPNELIWDEECNYEIRCYNVDFSKVPCGTRLEFDRVKGYTICRIAPNVAIKDEWLTEVKK